MPYLVPIRYNEGKDIFRRLEFMKYMTGNELRQAYLSFFESKGHLRLDSFSLIPQNDPTLLLIGAGMAPLKPFFTGKLVPPRTRVTTCQKCIRTGDIENVGRTARHHTFFEMLGNFSFGDYFKTDAIHWAWEFLTQVIELPVEKLYVTVYPEDKEAYDLWRQVGMPEDHISKLEDNFWEIGEGPCGPDSEIFFDLGPERGCGSPDCAPGCDCDRYLEIWNLVFTQFNRTADGKYEPLEHKNIDTGCGLERLASVLQGTESNFETDLIFPIIEAVAKEAGVTYHSDAKTDISLKVIGDHIRAITVLISDGVLPSNEGRGYVLRRILRRAVRHGRLLGIEKAFLADLVDVVISILGPALPDLVEKKDFIKRVVANEEQRFNQTLAQGLTLLSDLMDQLKADKKETINGADVFKLYDTYGFPVELTAEIAHDAGFAIDEKGFDVEMKAQRDRARAAREELGAKVQVNPDITSLAGQNLICDERATSSKIMLLARGTEVVTEVADGEEVTLILETTPFHAEGGGQVGDTGMITGPMGKIQIENTRNLPDGTTCQFGKVIEGTLSTGDQVSMEVASGRHLNIARNHTATHLLQAALRKVLGDHVNQAGSLVLPDRLRFDFTHFSAMTQEELDQVESLVNEEILKAQDLVIKEMPIADAKALGARALFGEKYGDVVRVVTVPDFSIELCGGSHVANTAVISSFRILSESGIGSGVRRIEAVTGGEALAMAKQDQKQLAAIADMVKAKPAKACARVEQVLSQVKDLEHTISAMRQEAAAQSMGDLLSGKFDINGLTGLVASVDAHDMDELRNMADMARDQIGSGVVLFGMVHGDKVNFVCMVTKDAVKSGLHAGTIVKAAAQAAGGNGGGRPDMAQAGGKEPDKLSDALEAGKQAILDLVK